MSAIDALFTDSLFLLAPNYDSVQGKVVVGFGRFDTPPLPTGNGYLAGEAPTGLTKVDGVPSSATIRVLLRTERGHPSDGCIVAETQSNQDGTWRVDGLNQNLRYDVVGRSEGFNDVIVANVQPELD